LMLDRRRSQATGFPTRPPLGAMPAAAIKGLPRYF
jgi:hypothetical protein